MAALIFMITLSKIKQQCRIDEADCCDDLLIISYLKSAKQHASNYIDKNLFNSEIERGDKDGIIIDDAIELAILMLIGHFYENRESTSDIKLYEIPLDFKDMLESYIKKGV